MSTTNPKFPKGIASITALPYGHNADGFGNDNIPVTGYIVDYKLEGDRDASPQRIQVLIDESGNLKLNSTLDPTCPGLGVPYAQSVLDWFQEGYYAGKA